METNEFKTTDLWEKKITISLTDGTTIEGKLETFRNSKLLGFQCTSCGSDSTLAFGECASCGNPFEPKEEKTNLLPSRYDFKEENPQRLEFILTHMMWLCKSCSGANMNYPRTGISNEAPNCVHCGKIFTPNESILFEDGEEMGSIQSAIENFQSKIHHSLHPKKPVQNINTKPSYLGNGENIHETLLPEKEITNPFFRNKGKIIIGVFGLVGFLKLFHYGFIEQFDTQIEVSSHQWKRVVYVENYLKQFSEGFQQRIQSSNYDQFTIIERYNKTDTSDCRDVATGRYETDYSNCLSYNMEKEKTQRTLSGGVIVEGEREVRGSCNTYGKKPVYEEICNVKPYIKFSYYDWKVTPEGTFVTAGEGKNPYWHTIINSRFDGITKRLKQPFSEEYKVTVNYGEKSEIISLDESSWNKLSQGETCTVKTTRFGGINIGSFKELCITK